MSVTKYIRRQDSGWKQCFGFSGETSINLSQEIVDYLYGDAIAPGDEYDIVFTIYKEDFEEAIAFINSQFPLYRSTSRTCDQLDAASDTYYKIINAYKCFFGDKDKVEYPVTMYYRRDGRIYLKGLKHNGFSIRDFLIENGSALEFILTAEGYSLRLRSAVFDIENN